MQPLCSHIIHVVSLQYCTDCYNLMQLGWSNFMATSMSLGMETSAHCVWNCVICSEQIQQFLTHCLHPLTSADVFQSPPSLHAWRQVPVTPSYTAGTFCMLLTQRGAYSKTESAPLLLPMEHIPAHGWGTEKGSGGPMHLAHQP